jgi:ADP-L-glycero-D-manno-heptose 6-epimerase
LNPYGISKNEFDKWALKQYSTPSCWYGLKFFNVYGPNEYHKGRMASVVFHSFEQISRPSGQGGKEASVRLFMSHNPKYKDGEQLRDFIYVKDVTDVIWFLMNHRKDSGIYNLGTGTARTFIDLVHAVFAALDRQPVIEFIPIPEDIREKYQYFTEAQMEKLFRIGCHKNYISLEAGIGEYVREYLIRDRVL